MSDDWLLAYEDVDAYSLADAARRMGTGCVIHALKPQNATTQFIGRALTARVHYDPNADIPVRNYDGWRVRERAGPGDVVILDGGGLELTVMGGLAVLQLIRRGARAAVVNACIRDAEEMQEMDFPVFALGTAISTVAGHAFITDIGEPVTVQGARISTGDLVSGCRGGVVVVPWNRKDDVLIEARRIIDSDRAVQEGLLRGESIESLWHTHKNLDEKSR